MNVPLEVDGMHRLFVGWEENEVLRCFVGSNLHPRPECLNYARPNSWSQVVVRDEVPPEQEKKFYRWPGQGNELYKFMIPVTDLRFGVRTQDRKVEFNRRSE